MPIPDFKKTADLQPLAAASLSIPTKPLPSLAVVTVGYSRNLVHCYRLVYGCFVMGLLLAGSTQVSQYNSGWAAVFVALMVVLCCLYRRQVVQVFTGTIWSEQGNWVLRRGALTKKYVLAGEVTCWPFVVVLPLRDQESQQLRYLVIAADSISPADNARLRTWLRVCLRPRG